MSRDEALMLIERWHAAGWLRAIDRAFARFVASFDTACAGEVLLVAALVSHQLGRKHVCLPLAALAADADRALAWPGDELDPALRPSCTLAFDHARWSAALAVLAEDNAHPLVFDGDRVYLRRYYNYEVAVAADLSARIAAGRFEVVTGGPGTGKTWTATRRVAAEPDRRIAIAAPTGKAANRLQKDLQELKPATLHRLLGAQPDTNAFRHGRDNPLAADLVIVDEASMIPLDLMAALLAAVRPDAQLVLLGDADQLASVEAGSVLADICAAGGKHITVLTESHRFGRFPGIGALAAAANAGDTDAFTAAFAEHEEIERVSFAADAFAAQVVDGYRGYLSALNDPAAALDALRQFQVLCALRSGDWGVVALNRRIETALAAAGLVDPETHWYDGRPVMVTRNDYALGLFNGDIGVTIDRRVWFRVDGGMKSFLPSRLPDCETSLAMTVHKSQGSEFDHTVLVLPEVASPILTRELVYTAITRAAGRFTLVVPPGAHIDREAVARASLRASGLADRLKST